MRHSSKTTGLALVALYSIHLLLVPIGAEQTNLDLKTLPVAVSVRFFCMWWSESSQEGLDPNNPPPYDEYIEIQEWSYTDPIGTPNPETIDIDVEIESLAAKTLEGLHVELLYQWKVGPIGNPRESRWEEPQSLNRYELTHLTARTSRQIKLPRIPIWDKQRRLPQGSWAWALKVICKVEKLDKVRKVDADLKLALTIERVLAILPGD